MFNCLIRHFTVNNQVHSRITRCAKFNLVCPKYVPETEGVESFLVRACKRLNKLSLELRRKDPFPVFKKSLFHVISKNSLVESLYYLA